MAVPWKVPSCASSHRCSPPLRHPRSVPTFTPALLILIPILGLTTTLSLLLCELGILPLRSIALLKRRTPVPALPVTREPDTSIPRYARIDRGTRGPSPCGRTRTRASCTLSASGIPSVSESISASFMLYSAIQSGSAVNGVLLVSMHASISQRTWHSLFAPYQHHPH
jgi:hypothetical protein